MPIDLAGYEERTREAVSSFWRSRQGAAAKHMAAGGADVGGRAGVTAGKNMDGFAGLIQDLFDANDLPNAKVYRERSFVTLPGYFRPTKLWDLLVMNGDRLVAALEFKSQVGPSFGNNFNNRTEEAVGTAHCLWTAYREGALGDQPRPFLGWIMLVEDAPGSRRPVRDASPHFAVFPEFQGASYLKRYDILCQRLVKENLYTAATLIASPAETGAGGEYSELSQLTGMRTFVSQLAAHIAAEAMMGG